jgi:hypothetical protein
MTTYDKDDVTALLRTALHDRLATPRHDARRRSWRAFQVALDRHLAKRDVRPVRMRS